MKILDLDNIIEYWGNKQLTPMVLVDAQNRVTWRNRWADWLFRFDISDNNLRQLPMGEILADYADMVRKYTEPPVINVSIFDMVFDVEGRMMGDDPSSQLMMLKFHTQYLSRATMLEMHKFMQDFALETGDRVNNPLTTVINCLHMMERGLGNEDEAKLRNYVELAIREAYVMKGFGDWVRRLSEEAPTREVFDPVPVLKKVLDRRNCLDSLVLAGPIPKVRGCAEHAALVLGGLVNLIRQASGKSPFTVTIAPRDCRLVTVEINTSASQVKDLRMLSEEFYGGLGLLAARYLLSLMQAKLELEYRGDVGVRVTFVTGAEVVG